jgi:DNA-binding response OmpR family regulator
MRVLFVEDNAQLAEWVAVGLRREGIAVDLALDGVEALELAALTAYDLMGFDRDQPRLTATRCAAPLVATDARPRLIMLSAPSNVDDRVDCLAIGAEDCLPKPFAFPQLTARVRCGQRRRAGGHWTFPPRPVLPGPPAVAEGGRHVCASLPRFVVQLSALAVVGTLTAAALAATSTAASAQEAPTADTAWANRSTRRRRTRAPSTRVRRRRPNTSSTAPRRGMGL